MARVFLGVSLSDGLQNKAIAWRNAHPNLPVRWIADKNIHITLLSPWEENDTESALEKLEGLKGEFKEICVDFNWISLGPNTLEPRLIWAYGRPPVEITKLATAAHKALALQTAERNFKLHITLARFHTEDFKKFPTKELHESIDWKMSVEKVTLFESILQPQGADYRPLGEISL